MARFSNVDYNKVQYKDENPFWAAFKESSEDSKNMAKEAYERKKGEFLDDYLINLEERMLPPDGIEVIDGKGNINPAFFNVDNYTPEKIIKHAKNMAQKYGLNPSAIKKSDIDFQLGQIRQHAVLRRMKLLRKWGNENGNVRLQNILGKDPKFKDFYQEHYDAYSNAGLPEPTGTRQQLPGGWEFTTDGRVADIPWVADMGEPTEVLHDDVGAYVPYGWFGQKKYLPAAYENMNFNNKRKP